MENQDKLWHKRIGKYEPRQYLLRRFNMWTSQLFRYTSGQFKLRHVISEVREVVQSKSLSELCEESKDVITTFSLWLYGKSKIDLYLPKCLSSGEKYLKRVQLCRSVLIQEGLYDGVREDSEGFYWAAYTVHGSNMENPSKRSRFIEIARADFRHVQK